MALFFQIFNLAGVVFLVYVIGANGINFTADLLSALIMTFCLIFLLLLGLLCGYCFVKQYFLTLRY
jgi:hypothetical protein